MKFGAIMRAMRERAGFSQEELASRIYLSQSCVSKYEKDHKVPDVPTLMQWAEVTCAKEVVVAFLMGIDGVTIMQSILTMISG